MKQVARSLFLILALSSAGALCAQTRPPDNVTQEPDVDVIRVSTGLVTLPVSVTDRHGRFVPDLKREQFTIFENGIEHEIAYFETADKPFVVALMLDISDSTEYQLREIQDAALGFIGQLRPADRVLIVAFDSRVSVLSELTSNRQALREAIRRIRPGGGTALYDALDLVVKKYLDPIHGRKAVVVFTDGVDTASTQKNYAASLHDARELDALVYTIQYNTYESATRRTVSGPSAAPVEMVTARGERLSIAYERGARYLRLLAENTGGRFFYANTSKRLTELFADVAKELRQQYSIGYYPKQQSPRRNAGDQSTPQRRGHCAAYPQVLCLQTGRRKVKQCACASRSRSHLRPE